MNICIFGASSEKIDEKYIDAAYNLSATLAKGGHNLVFGGGKYGVMGACARGFHDNKAKVLGIAPYFMEQYNVLYDECTEFITTQTMAERKTIMEDNADAFIIAPGGIGTYEEFYEVFTLKQLGRHRKPIIIFNCFGYYNDMMKMLQYTIDEKFLAPASTQLIGLCDDAREIIDYLKNYQPQSADVSKLRFDPDEK